MLVYAYSDSDSLTLFDGPIFLAYCMVIRSNTVFLFYIDYGMWTSLTDVVLKIAP